MVAATVVAALFVGLVTITWLSSRADASQSRCEDLAQHIRNQLERPPPRRTAATGPRNRARP